MPSAQARTPDLKQVQSLQTAWKVVLGYYTTRQSHIKEPHSQPKTVGNQRSPESGCIKESKTVQGAKKLNNPTSCCSKVRSQIKHNTQNA